MSDSYYRRIENVRAIVKNLIAELEAKIHTEGMTRNEVSMNYDKLRIQIMETCIIPEKHLLQAIKDYDPYGFITGVPE